MPSSSSFSHPDSAPQRLSFYKIFVLKFADKINQLKLVDLALKAATQCKGSLKQTPGAIESMTLTQLSR